MNRVIHDPSELDALPVESVIKAWTTSRSGRPIFVRQPDGWFPRLRDFETMLPATVLYDPSDPAPAPSVVPEAAVTLRSVIDQELADALGDTFSPSVMDDLARRVHDRVAAALPHLTAAPSATREASAGEVTETVTEALTDAHREERGMSRHRGLTFEDESAIRDRAACVIDLVTARFTITPKEDR